MPEKWRTIIEVLVALRAQSELNVWTGCAGRNRLLAVSLTWEKLFVFTLIWMLERSKKTDKVTGDQWLWLLLARGGVPTSIGFSLYPFLSQNVSGAFDRDQRCRFHFYPYRKASGCIGRRWWVEGTKLLTTQETESFLLGAKNTLNKISRVAGCRSTLKSMARKLQASKASNLSSSLKVG